jgi:WD40 repeat protein
MREKDIMTGLILIAGALLTLCILGGCIEQHELFEPEIPDQCVTPLQKISTSVSPGGISTIHDGSLFGVATRFEGVCLFTNHGRLLWTDEGTGSTYAILLNNGAALLAESYNKEDSSRSTIIKFDPKGKVLWERQTGLIGLDGLAATEDGSFIAVGAVDEEKKGHLMLFGQDGDKAWDHQIDGRIETVAVSKSGYVVSGPRDRYIYLYNLNGDLIFTYLANSIFDSQDVAIAPDESFFLFGSEHQYLNCYSLQGGLLWKRDIGPLCNISISADSGYIAVGTSNSTLYLFDRDGNQLWGKKATDANFISEVSISGHGEYVVIESLEEPSFLVSNYCVVVYSNKGEILWKYWGTEPYLAIAISEDGHYVAAGNKLELLFFDNFQAIEEYKSGECIS